MILNGLRSWKKQVQKRPKPWTQDRKIQSILFWVILTNYNGRWIAMFFLIHGWVTGGIQRIKLYGFTPVVAVGRKMLPSTSSLNGHVHGSKKNNPIEWFFLLVRQILLRCLRSKVRPLLNMQDVLVMRFPAWRNSWIVWRVKLGVF